MKAWRDSDGELFARYLCDQGHEFDVGPIHDPEASEPHPDVPGVVRSVPGSGKPAHVPDAARCVECMKLGRPDSYGGRV